MCFKRQQGKMMIHVPKLFLEFDKKKFIDDYISMTDIVQPLEFKETLTVCEWLELDNSQELNIDFSLCQSDR